MAIKTVGLFCGSHEGKNVHFKEAAAEMGTLIAKRGYTFVYGGSNWGYMGISSGAALAEKGRVIGVIPDFFAEEVIHSQPVTELVIVKSMSERKQHIAKISDAFVALPGGVGTLDEVTEMLTNNQLGFGCKPVGLLNIDGFYDPFLQQLQLMFDEGLLRKSNYDTILSASSPEELLAKMESFTPPDDSLWLQKVRGNR
jgi:uncharacterized protein (TIGR00730 family)